MSIKDYILNNFKNDNKDSIKEAIIPMNIEKPKAPNMPAPSMGVGAAPAMGSVPVGDPMVGAGNFNGIAEAAAEDMPF